MRASRPHQVAHVALRIGRLLMTNGADSAHVQSAVLSYAGQSGFQARLLVGTEGLLLTLEDEDGFHTRLGPTIAGAGVNMGALAALDGTWRDESKIEPDPVIVDRHLEQIEQHGGLYPRWLVIVGMGVTAAALARLFGAAWPAVAASVLVGMVTQYLRQRLNASSANPVAGAGLTAFGGGLVGALAMKLFPGVSPTLCLVAAGMILMPGVLLINGVRDILGSHVGTGVTRLALGTVTVLAIALGLFLAAAITGDTLPVEGSVPLLPAAEDFLFSALAGVGFALLFNVPARAAWACALCAMSGHGLRTSLEHLGIELSVASLIGAFMATLLARLFAHRFKVPPVIFAFPGVVAMIPGSYAFRAGIGGLAILNAGDTVAPSLIGATIGLTVTAILVTSAIAIGLCLALALPPATDFRMQRNPGGAPR